MKSVYSHIREVWKKPSKDILKPKIIEWRKSQTITKIKRPTRLDRARSLGYKAKQGFLIARVKVRRGGRLRELFKGGRKPRKMRRMKIVSLSYQTIAESRANDKFHNFEVLNSYFVAKDGNYYWYEVILIDPYNPVIIADKNLRWIKNIKGRVYRGLTSSSKKSRGLRIKGKGAEKARPSKKANLKRKWHKSEKKGKHFSN